MDAIFNRRNFLNEIIWCYNVGGKGKRRWARKHDVILFYAKSKEYKFYGEAVGIPRDTGSKSFGGKIGTDEKGRRYQDKIVKKTGKIYRYYLDKPKIPEDWWTDINSLQSGVKERIGYPTQKPLKLLDRIIKASSNSDSIVFDPFCGCATTLVAADRLHRQWIGIDISSKAVELVIDRIKQDQGLFRGIIARNDIPQRTDIEVLRLYNSLDNKKHLYGQQAGNCNGCSQHFETRHFEVDHIIARSQGGTDHIENLQLLCGNCNRVKGNRGQEYLIAKLEGRKVAYS